MFTKNQLIESLEVIRRSICSYMGFHCDCKYGIDEKALRSHVGERTGCPELRFTMDLLTELIEDEFDELVKRREGEPKEEIIGKTVTVYDRYLFGVPVRGTVGQVSKSDGAYMVTFFSNNPGGQNVTKHNGKFFLKEQCRIEEA